MNEQDDDHDEDNPLIYQTAESCREALELLRNSTTPVTSVTLTGSYNATTFQRIFSRMAKWCHLSLINGTVEIYELPSPIHDRAGEEIFVQLRDQSRFIRSTLTSDIQFNETTILQPDMGIIVENPNVLFPGARDSRNRKIPKLIVEVSYHQPHSRVFPRVDTYFSIGNGHGVRAVLIIIIRQTTGDVAQPARALQLVAVLYQYGALGEGGVPLPSAAISFGDYLHSRTKHAIESSGHVPANMMRGVGIDDAPPCNDSHRQEYLLPIPKATVLFHDFTEEEIAATDVVVEAPYFHIDLYSLQRFIRLELPVH